MDINRYNELYKEMNPSLKMKLNTIRMNLHEGKASCLVGAGFSKNAEMDDATHMKDWFELADDFYETLYGEKPNDKNVRYKSVLRLASQVEASKGRGVLETLIQNSLPDERVYPGRLHIELMKLPWSDVFTTNYDTLLEKAFIEADRYYYKVTNKETLLYTPHPRLMKLHGSFPDIRPFIITEEDYRTYPQKFPEFVNTVRQSLIENILCLIGFSGDDPNFLSWIGWLRDVMGAQASPVYQITYNNQMHDSNIHLSHDLGIDIINLADIKNINGFSEALDFFLTHIGKDYKTEWSGELKYVDALTYDCEKCDIDALIKEMRRVRESYPGWIVLPASHLNEFSDTKRFMPIWSSIYKKCADVIEQINFLHEVNWRIETALASSDMDWYLMALKQLPFERINGLDNSTYQKLLGLKISLLNAYRIKGYEEDYAQLLAEIENHISQITYEQNRQLTYVKCLYAISSLIYSDVQRIVEQWDLRSLDYQGHLWKAGVLLEIGQLREAQIMLRDLLKSVKRNILTSKYSAQLSSIRSAVELFLWRMDHKYSMGKTNSDFDFAGIVRTCRDMIDKEEKQPSHYQITHGFNLLAIGRQWNLGENGFKGDYYGVIRYFLLYEKLGLPFGMPKGFSTGIETKTFMIERLSRYYPKYALQWIVRSCNEKIAGALNRETLLHISREDACVFFDKSIASCEAGLNQYAGILQTRVLISLLPILVKLSVLLTPDRIERVFDVLCIVYRQYPKKYDGEQVQTLYNNLSGEPLKRCKQIALEQPILQSGVREEDFKMPHLRHDEIEYSIKAGEIAMKGLSSDNDREQRAAYYRLRLLNRTIKDKQTSYMLYDCINKWREKQPLSDEKLDSFYMFPTKENTMEMESIASSELNLFLNTDFISDMSSTFIEGILNNLLRLQFCFSNFKEEQHVLFLNKVTKILTENEELFKKDDSDCIFGGFRSLVEKIFPYLDYYSKVEGLPSKNNDAWQSFKAVIERYHGYEYPVLTIMTHLAYMGIWDKTTIMSYMNTNLLSSSKSLLRDAGHALIYMAKKQGSKVNQSIIKKIINEVSYVFDEDTHTYLYILKNVLLNNGMSNGTRTMLGDWVKKLPDRIEHYSILEEIKDDIRYRANQISGIMSIVWQDWSGLSDWQAYIKKEHIKNDVKNGFEYGVRLAESKKEAN